MKGAMEAAMEGPSPAQPLSPAMGGPWPGKASGGRAEQGLEKRRWPAGWVSGAAAALYCLLRAVCFRFIFEGKRGFFGAFMKLLSPHGCLCHRGAAAGRPAVYRWPCRGVAGVRPQGGGRGRAAACWGRAPRGALSAQSSLS